MDEDNKSNCCRECGAKLESDGTCNICEYIESLKKED